MRGLEGVADAGAELAEWGRAEQGPRRGDEPAALALHEREAGASRMHDAIARGADAHREHALAHADRPSASAVGEEEHGLLPGAEAGHPFDPHAEIADDAARQHQGARIAGARGTRDAVDDAEGHLGHDAIALEAALFVGAEADEDLVRPLGERFERQRAHDRARRERGREQRDDERREPDRAEGSHPGYDGRPRPRCRIRGQCGLDVLGISSNAWPMNRPGEAKVVRRRLRCASAVVAAPTALAMLAVLGCNAPRYAARTSGQLTEVSAPALAEMWDYELVGEAFPSNILQLESMLRASPGDERLLMAAIKAYVGYAYGWIDDEAEALEAAGRDFEAQQKRERARYLYLRARDLGVHLLSLRDEGVREALDSGPEALDTWARAHMRDREDAAPLLWTGYAWGLYINDARDDIAAVDSLPLARALVERSVAMDPNLDSSTGMLFLATQAAQDSEPDFDRAQRLYEDVLARTERRALSVQVAMARYYAVPREDVALFRALLREVLEAGDIDPSSRLANRIARRRAARYLRQVEELFPDA